MKIGKLKTLTFSRSMLKMLTVCPWGPLSPFLPVFPGIPGFPAAPSEPGNPGKPGFPLGPWKYVSDCQILFRASNTFANVLNDIYYWKVYLRLVLVDQVDQLAPKTKNYRKIYSFCVFDSKNIINMVIINLLGNKV